VFRKRIAPPTEGGERDTARLEAFSDGVFAIAITLLILEIDVPLHSEHLLHDLAHKWPSFLAYALSFLVILIMWVNHHTIFRLISRIDRRFLILNGLLLMLITFLNYPTAVLADYLTSSHAGTALVLYNGTFVIVALTFSLLWWYAAHENRLLAPDVDPERVAMINRAYRLGPFIYMAAFLMAFVSVPLSLAIDIGLAIYFTVFNV
jgi:uncharacterized membrane protein